MTQDFIEESKGKDFSPASADVHDAVLCESVDLGMQKDPIYGKEQPKGIWIFQVAELDEQGQRKTVWAYFTRKLGTRDMPSRLRKWIVSWRGGKEFEQSELPIDIGSYIGKPCRIVLSHKVNTKGKTVAQVDSILPSKVAMEPLDYTTYGTIMAKKAERDAKNGAGKSSQGSVPYQTSAQVQADDIPF